MSSLATWVFLVMVALQPRAPWRDTYGDTAQAIAAAAEERPVWRTAHRTAALLVAMAWHESRFRPDARAADGSFGLWQVHPSMVAPGVELASPTTAARLALELVEESFRVCRGRPELELLGWYASGRTCRGTRASRYRMHLAQRLTD